MCYFVGKLQKNSSYYTLTTFPWDTNLGTVSVHREKSENFFLISLFYLPLSPVSLEVAGGGWGVVG